jgi:hypothetical protein
VSALVLTVPDALSEEELHRLSDGLAEWDRQKPIVLMDGARLSTIGGLTFTVALSDGPLDGVAFTINVDGLADLPEFFGYEGGAYRRWLADDGAQMHTTEGGVAYRWEAT